MRLGARDYDPSLGRWLSRDPLLIGRGDTNYCNYAYADPVNSRDSDGLEASRLGGRSPAWKPSPFGETMMLAITEAGMGTAGWWLFFSDSPDSTNDRCHTPW